MGDGISGGGGGGGGQQNFLPHRRSLCNLGRIYAALSFPDLNFAMDCLLTRVMDTTDTSISANTLNEKAVLFWVVVTKITLGNLLYL